MSTARHEHPRAGSSPRASRPPASAPPAPGRGPAALVALALFGAALALGGWRPRPVHAEGRDEDARRHDSLIQGMDCSACHTPDGWTMAPGDGRGGGFDHARTGFPLVGRHAAVTCIACHAPGREVRQDCASCHRSPHQGRLSRDCGGCHVPRTWESARAVVMHARTRLPLTGAHLLADCTQCHRRTGERQWTSPPVDCVACHEAEVRNARVHPDHLGRDGGAPFPRDCAICHRTSTWSPAFVQLDIAPIHSPLAARDAIARGEAPRDHELRFPIRTGAHRGLDCRTCHARPAVPRDVRCTGCHAHAGAALARDHAGQAVPTAATACLSCHPGGRAR